VDSLGNIVDPKAAISVVIFKHSHSPLLVIHIYIDERAVPKSSVHPKKSMNLLLAAYRYILLVRLPSGGCPRIQLCWKTKPRIQGRLDKGVDMSDFSIFNLKYMYAPRLQNPFGSSRGILCISRVLTVDVDRKEPGTKTM